MNNIEKLAIEHRLIGSETVCDGSIRATYLKRIEAFAKALQSSEPFIYINKDAWKKGELDWCTPEYKKGDCDNFKHRYTMPLYEKPTASVPLEKYNKLLEIMKIAKTELEMQGCDVLEKNDVGYMVHQLVTQAIAEAEGKV